MAYCLGSVSALALVGFGFVDRIKVCSQADLASAHLCDNRADRPMCASMCSERSFTRSDPKPKEFSAMFGLFPGLLPFVSHRLTDDGFCGCR
jgi:hypothetical protein